MSAAINREDFVVAAVRVINEQIKGIHSDIEEQMGRDAKRYAALNGRLEKIIDKLDEILEKCGEVEDA